MNTNPQGAVAGNVLMPDTRTRLQHFLQINRQPPAVPDNAPLAMKTAAEALGSASEIGHALMAEESRLSKDSSLSNEGRQRKLKEAAEKHAKAFQRSVDAALQPLTTELDERKVKLPKLKNVGDFGMPTTAWMIELCREFRGADMLKRSAAFKDAVENGDELTFYAFVHAPRAIAPQLPAELLQNGKRDFLRRRDPEAFDMYELGTRLHETLTNQKALVASMLTEHAALRFRSNPQPQSSPFPLPHGG